ncbi:efflux RND transporter periplasmic adaptor subunit [Agarivorans sp. Toyoura001]|uniref:efflux RND transporter periplasmic adaptor subunit n=1 Tax=unclassified Agarivorans TaxID=2636026 RepID=UPI0010E11430|nr:efflux RND transporter periplasmic adaptor subunit [Agarivorans sp. Toyoura001]GDY26156.1 MexH family multidrug efflux RND transporter periplasmic adaptor subunit [Agarivorans sp. Toyoura001]
MKKWMAIMLVLTVILFGSVFGFYLFKQKMIAQFMANRPVPEMPVEVALASSQDWQPAIESIGFIEPYQGVNITSSVAGLVTKIHFSSGDTVRAGELLVSLEADVEKANLASATAKLPAVKRQMERNKSLLERGSVSQTQFDDSEANYLALVNDIAALKATIERREIRAPFSGVMGIRQINLGQYVQAGDDMARLENLDHMLLRFIVPQKDISLITLGTEIELNSDAYPDQWFKGQVTTIEPTVDPQSGVVQVQATIPNTEGQLRSGMYASVRIWQPVQANQIVVPQQAISFSLYGESLYVVESQTAEDGSETLTATQRTIQVGERRGDVAIIKKGVAADEQVVVSGQVRLRNGALVRIVEDSFLNRDQNLPKD